MESVLEEKSHDKRRQQVDFAADGGAKTEPDQGYGGGIGFKGQLDIPLLVKFSQRRSISAG